MFEKKPLILLDRVVRAVGALTAIFFGVVVVVTFTLGTVGLQTPHEKFQWLSLFGALFAIVLLVAVSGISPDGLARRIPGPIWRAALIARAPSYVAAILLVAVFMNHLYSEHYLAMAGKRDIVVDREVLLPVGTAINPHAILQAADGGYLISGWTIEAGSEGGTSDQPRFVRTDLAGNVLWEAELPPLEGVLPDGGEGLRTRHLPSAVELPDHSFLACGDGPDPNAFAATVKLVGSDGKVHVVGAMPKGMESGLAVRIGSDGRLIEARSMFPSNRRAKWSGGSFQECLRWGNGFVLTGSASLGFSTRGWVVKLDKNLHEEWEKVFDDVRGGFDDAMELPNHNLLLLGGSEMTVVDSKGDVVAKRAMSGIILRSSSKNSEIWVAQMATSVLRMRSDLTSLAPPVKLKGFSVDQGFTVADGSLVLFGSIRKGVYPTMAIALCDSNGGIKALHMFAPVLYDTKDFAAARVSGVNRFVEVQQRNETAPRKHGLEISWITIHMDNGH